MLFRVVVLLALVALAAASGDTVDDDDRDDGNIFGLKLWNQTDIMINRSNIARYTNPNFLFHSCCEERRLPPACIQKCHFNTYEKEAVG
ncbi:hypothetical protein GCK32_014934 [Trichostrongylus colubriformis]|uniref:Uncharacterized protein n=1 Tax=Trichostrongylus colubriformis TaxID=6319 RepID=A0AAN8FUJ0_TRICO